MKKLVFLIVLVTVLMSLIAPIAKADPRPFSPYLWAREMSIPYFEFGVPDKEIGKFVEGFMINPTLISKEEGEVERAFFVGKDSKGKEHLYFFRLGDMTGDPRETEWWQENIYTASAKSLNEMVRALAKTGSNDQVTGAILADIVGRGYAEKNEVGRDLSLDRIRAIIVAYTEEVEIQVKG